MKQSRRNLSVTGAIALAAALLGGCAATANPDALWHIVSASCMSAYRDSKGNGLCTQVSADGYVILKDIRGKSQYLLMPATRVTGIEDPALQQGDPPNYWRYAWDNRHYVSDALGRPVPDELMSLALNSPYGRSQNQYHIHLDCTSRATRQSLAAHDHDAPGVWTNATLNGHFYQVMRVQAETAADVDPFALALQQARAARQSMSGHTLFMTSAPGGFYIVDGYYAPGGPRVNPGSAEELQDHGCKDVSPAAL
jgi:CDP-diacylglycerol pyrophosphatase